MSKYNGTGILLVINGQEVACQKGMSISVSRKQVPVSNKQDGDWEMHINGKKTSSVPFTALQSTTGFSANELYDLINGSAAALLVITGFAYPYVAEVDLQTTNIDAPDDEAVTLQGTFVVNGKIYRLSGDNANLVTDPDDGGTDYDTMTVSGIKISSAINAAGTAYVNSNAFSVTEADVIKVALYLTKTSGQLPTVSIWDNTSADISNAEALVEGLNFVTLTVTGSDASASLRFINTGAANWSTSNIYCFKDN